jgi:SWI/SNF-related matrix-associated actin-dependent regulator of chromatin subfamily A member 5
MQRKWYKSVLEKDIDAVNGTYTILLLFIPSIVFFNTRFVGLTGKKEGKTRLMNMVMQVSWLWVLCVALGWVGFGAYVVL